MQFLLNDRSDAEGIVTIRFVTGTKVRAIALTMYILRAERPVLVCHIFRTERITVLGNTPADRSTVNGIVDDTAARPSEGTDAHALDRHEPYTADDILAVVLVFLVDTLTIEDTNLVV